MSLIITSLLSTSILMPLHSVDFNSDYYEQISTEEKSKGEEKTVHIKYDEIKESKPEYEIKMKIPILSGINDTFFQLKLNHALKKEAKDKRSSFITEATSAVKELEDKGQKVRPHQLYEEAILKMSTGMISLYRETYLYQGGANGNTTIKTTNFLNTDKVKLLTFPDLFIENSNYSDSINKMIKAEVLKRNESGLPYFEGEEGFKTVTEEQNFYFTDSNLVILFNQNEIAPSAVGIPVFHIPIEDIKKILKPEVLDALKS